MTLTPGETGFPGKGCGGEFEEGFDEERGSCGV